jgi:RNA polymerase subunit RPABC4/transcription elongation factor Spt4
MSFCVKCGKELLEEARFCDSCGSPVPNCQAPREATALDKNTYRETIAPGGDVRCVHCGAVVESGKQFCGYCGEPALNSEEFDRKVGLYKNAEKIKKKLTRLAAVMLIVFVVIFGILLFVLNPMPGSTLASYISIPSDAFQVILISFALLYIAASYISHFGIRARELKKAGLTVAQYRQLDRKYKNLPKDFWQSIPAKGQDSTKGGLKSGRPLHQFGWKVILILGIAATLTVGGLMINAVSGGASGSSETLSGRWEASGGGYYDPAIVFKDGHAYVSMICDSDAEIISNAGGVRRSTDNGGVSYTLTKSTITLTSNGGGSKTYKRSGNTFYFGSYKMIKVDSKN